MKKNLGRLILFILVICTLVTVGFAYEDGEIKAPGSIVSFDNTYFTSKDGPYIDSRVPFNSKYFTVSKKSFSKGSNLVKEIKINSRWNELQIIFQDEGIEEAPTRPNVILNDLQVKCIKSYRDSDGTYLVRSGDVFSFGEPLLFTVGNEPEVINFTKDDTTLTLSPGDNRYIKWQGSSYGDVVLDYAHIASATTRVVDGDKGFYIYKDEVPSNVQNRNQSAFIESLNLGTKTFAAPLNLRILVPKSSYIYYYDGGSLTTANGVKWDSTEDAYTIRLTKGRHFIISDEPLKGTGSGSNTTGGHTPEDEEYWMNGEFLKPEQLNPNTGKSTAVSISAIAAIAAIAIVSVVMNTVMSKSVSPRKAHFKKKNR